MKDYTYRYKLWTTMRDEIRSVRIEVGGRSNTLTAFGLAAVSSI